MVKEKASFSIVFLEIIPFVYSLKPPGLHRGLFLSGYQALWRAFFVFRMKSKGNKSRKRTVITGAAGKRAKASAVCAGGVASDGKPCRTSRKPAAVNAPCNSLQRK